MSAIPHPTSSWWLNGLQTCVCNPSALEKRLRTYEVIFGVAACTLSGLTIKQAPLSFAAYPILIVAGKVALGIAACAGLLYVVQKIDTFATHKFLAMCARRQVDAYVQTEPGARNRVATEEQTERTKLSNSFTIRSTEIRIADQLRENARKEEEERKICAWNKAIDDCDTECLRERRKLEISEETCRGGLEAGFRRRAADLNWFIVNRKIIEDHEMDTRSHLKGGWFVTQEMRQRRDPLHEKSAETFKTWAKLGKVQAEQISNFQWMVQWDYDLCLGDLSSVLEWLYQLEQTEDFRTSSTGLSAEVCCILSYASGSESWRKGNFIQHLASTQRTDENHSLRALRELSVLQVLDKQGKEMTVPQQLRFLVDSLPDWNSILDLPVVEQLVRNDSEAMAFFRKDTQEIMWRLAEMDIRVPLPFWQGYRNVPKHYYGEGSAEVYEWYGDKARAFDKIWKEEYRPAWQAAKRAWIEKKLA